ncbi:cell wall metabolism sensor histidine kinase WalK [Aquihabitans sp. G128]|uniref:sensor histidine kinase n=1 Tax=Aquihabitans sp. G128 TaxID=2849779 RepID=UPI0020B44373|nr:HAMP domain-containing sensor histidine kinase [Aquihabitans sp. G128]
MRRSVGRRSRRFVAPATESTSSVAEPGVASLERERAHRLVRAATRRLQRIRFRSIRVRTTLLATVVLGATLLLGAAGLLAVLDQRLTDNVERSARLRAGDVAALIEAGAPLDRLAADDVDESLLQVLDPTGTVVASSSNVDGQPPVLDLPVGSTRTVAGLALSPEQRFVVVSEPATVAQGRYVVLAARSVDPAEDSVEAVRNLLFVAIPLLVAAVASTTWFVTGRALRPVEAIRAEAEAIGATAAGRRVPEPASGDEVALLARTLNDMLDRLEQASDRQRRFVSDASHELRSPIATIRNLVEVARSDPEGLDVDVLTAGVLAEDLRLQHLVDDLLLLARLDEGRREPATAVDLDDLVFEEARRTRAATPIEFDLTNVSGGQVLGNPKELQAVVRNLIDNAARHARSKVVVTLLRRAGRVILTVDDDGDGIAPQDRDAVFERFARLDTSRARDQGGHGLGLAIVRDVVMAHGGTVAAGGSDLGGATFVVDLPAHT